MTKEHIWPKCIINRTPKLTNRLLGNQKKIIYGELTIADVCAKCNNGNLSNLDSYLCTLYDQYFFNYKSQESTVVLKYNYDLLLRSFLKISFNSLRTMKNGENYLSKYKDYILNGGQTPEDISILVELIPPSIVENQTIHPHSVRSGEVKIEEVSDWVKIRLISLNSFYFYLVIGDSLIDDIPQDELELLQRWGQKAKLEPLLDSVLIYTSIEQDTLHIHRNISEFK